MWCFGMVMMVACMLSCRVCFLEREIWSSWRKSKYRYTLYNYFPSIFPKKSKFSSYARSDVIQNVQSRYSVARSGGVSFTYDGNLILKVPVLCNDIPAANAQNRTCFSSVAINVHTDLFHSLVLLYHTLTFVTPSSLRFNPSG